MLAERVIGGFLLALCSCSSIDRAFERGWREEFDRARIDVEHYSIAIDIDPARRTIAGACTIRVWLPRIVLPAAPEPSSELQAAVAEPVAELTLDFDGLAVDSITDTDGRALAWMHDRDRLVVSLASPLRPGDFAEVTVRYSGSPRAGLWFARERDGVPTQIYTHGQCTEARSWFPCRDQPHDRATSEVRVTMPSPWSAIAAGERIERVEHGDRATELWRMSFPHPAYLATLAAGEFTIEHDEWENLPLQYACAPDDATFLRETFAETGAILEYFSDLTGMRYPYAKYAQVCVDNYPLGGMENISATTLTDTILPDARALSEASPRELIAHEAAHQWFGDVVTCADWNDAWLNEGFATYFAALYEEHASGRDDFERVMRGLRDVYLARNVGANRRPIVQSPRGNPLSAFFTGHVYQGGATRLHYLRGVLGDEAFFAGIRRYLARHRGRGVTTAELRVAFEEVSRRDLRRFFETWLHDSGHPEIETRWSFDARKKRVVLSVEQSQLDADDTQPPFDIELDVEIAAEKGTRVERVHVDRRLARFDLACETEPAWVRVDPRDWVPMKLDERMSAGSWIALAERGDAAGRLRALGVLERSRDGELTSHEGDVVEELLARLAAEDEYAEVRRTALVAITRMHAAKRRAAVRDLCLYSARHDVDRGVKIAAFHGLRAFGRDAEVRALAESALARAEGWNLRGEIVGLIAVADPVEAYAYLERALETRSTHGVFEARVLTELLATKDPRARGVLLAWLRDEMKPDAARVVAVRELTRTRLQGGELEAVIDLLASPRIRLRREALTALGTSSDARARTALELHIASRPSAIELWSADEALERLPDEP